MVNRNCANCVFYRLSNGAVAINENVEIKQEAREKLQKKKYLHTLGHASIFCYKKIWDLVRVEEKNYDAITSIIFTEREKNVCFFYPYRPLLVPDGAEELQKRDYENKQLKDEIIRTNIGLRIAAIGLIFSAIFSLMSFVQTCVYNRSDAHTKVIIQE